MTKLRPLALGALALLTMPAVATAHPVPKNTHDRTLRVSVLHDPPLVRVEYRLEVDELTAFTRDLEPYADDIDALRFRGRPEALYGELARRLGPDLAFRLSGKVNAQRLEFACTKYTATLHDENRTPLGHLRLDFVFDARCTNLLDSGNELVFRDQTYLGEEGKIDLGLAEKAGILALMLPDDALKKRTLVEREPGDDDRLRELRGSFPPSAQAAGPQVAEPVATPQAAAPAHEDYSLIRLLLHTDYGFMLTMLMACVFGAAHALTPGHGKTLVAAYLVGERGTVGHAVVLGLVTTLTHTGVVLLIAATLFFLPGEARESFGRVIQNGLGLTMGLLVVCMGSWLLLQRLAGRADHVHVGGGHHHHHHHGEPEPVVNENRGGVRWWGLIVLGITGGLVPCWDAIYLLLYAVGRNMLGLALPAVLAFSAGLAGVLVLIGVLVVQVPNFARSRWGNGRFVRALPIASALVVTLMGVWLCYEGVYGH
jgi:ABC-type nickel/cobalt efflux system permease component RcnA